MPEVRCYEFWQTQDYNHIIKCGQGKQVMSVSMQNTRTEEPQPESKGGSLWHSLHTLPLLTHTEEYKTWQHKTSVGKTEGSHGYKRQPSILPPSRAPKPQPVPHLCPFHLFLHLWAPVGPACPDAAPAAGAFPHECAQSAASQLCSCSSPSYSHCCAEWAKMK